MKTVQKLTPKQANTDNQIRSTALERSVIQNITGGFKLGCTRVCIIFLFFLLNIDSGYSLEPYTHDICLEKQKENHQSFSSENYRFYSHLNSQYIAEARLGNEMTDTSVISVKCFPLRFGCISVLSNLS